MHIVYDLKICTWLASRISLQLPDIIFNTRIEILTLTNLYLDIHEISFIYASFKKEISILSHIAKKLQTLEFLQNLLSKNAPGKKKCLGFLGKTGQFLPKLISNSKINCISTSFEKRISILSHIAKKLQAHQFLQN